MNSNNELTVTMLTSVDKKENLYLNEYSELTDKVQRAMLELDGQRVTSYIRELKRIESKEELTSEDYHQIFKLKRRIARTEAFKVQYASWFMNNLELGIAIYQAGCNMSNEYNPVVSYGVGMPKGMYVDFEDNFLRIMKKSDFYNDYAYAVISKNSEVTCKVLFKEVIDSIKKIIEECDGELSFSFVHNGETVEYPLFQKEKCIKRGEDTVFCTLVVSEDINNSLINAINEHMDVISNIHTINVHNEGELPVYDNVVDFTSKKD